MIPTNDQDQIQQSQWQQLTSAVNFYTVYNYKNQRVRWADLKINTSHDSDSLLYDVEKDILFRLSKIMTKIQTIGLISFTFMITKSIAKHVQCG